MTAKPTTRAKADLRPVQDPAAALTAPPPHDVNAEIAVLGSLLITDAVMRPILQTGLVPDDFYRHKYANAFAAAIEVHESGAGVDVITLSARLAERGQLDEFGGKDAVDALAAGVPSIANAANYARTVRRRRVERDLRLAALDVAANPAAEDARRRLLDLDLAIADSAIVLSVEDFLAVDRPKVEPYVAGPESVLLAPGTALLIAGPSGKGKSLAALDLAGQLASPNGGDWLGLTVRGGLRVLCVLLEGSDDDTATRARALIPADARERVFIFDRWRGPIGRDLHARVARYARTLHADIVLLDTLAAFFHDRYDVQLGIPEAAFTDLDYMRRLAGIDFAIVAVHHTRKADRNGKTHDELEEIAGTIAKKVDAAIVIRGDGDSPHRRKIAFAKARTGPPLPGKIATLPTEAGAAPRLTVIGDLGGRPITKGTEAERIADWIRDHDRPQATPIVVAELQLPETTLRRRRLELERIGITHGTVPGRGKTVFYGTDEQWRNLLGDALGDPPQASAAASASGGYKVPADTETASPQGTSDPPPATRRNPPADAKTRVDTGKTASAATLPLKGDRPTGESAPDEGVANAANARSLGADRDSANGHDSEAADG